MGGLVLQRLGAVTYQMTHADTLAALESGNLDAAEFVCPHDDERMGFVKFARFNYYPCWWEGSGMLHMVVNLEQWNALPKTYQAILARACDASTQWMRAKYDSVNPPALRKLVAAGAVLKPFPQPVLEACYKASGEHLSEIAGKSIHFKKALDALNGYRADHLAWRQIAEHAYDGFMIAATRGKA
jgi:TRAP-type mannitol/chloroaromatic compound transport system substrate-binding protein